MKMLCLEHEIIQVQSNGNSFCVGEMLSSLGWETICSILNLLGIHAFKRLIVSFERLTD